MENNKKNSSSFDENLLKKMDNSIKDKHKASNLNRNENLQKKDWTGDITEVKESENNGYRTFGFENGNIKGFVSNDPKAVIDMLKKVGGEPKESILDIFHKIKEEKKAKTEEGLNKIRNKIQEKGKDVVYTTLIECIAKYEKGLLEPKVTNSTTLEDYLEIEIINKAQILGIIRQMKNITNN